MIQSDPTIQEKLFLAIRTISIMGLMTISALLVSFNHKAFDRVFKQKGFVYWSLFFAFSIIPLVLIIFLWNFFFMGKLRIEPFSAFAK